MNDDERCCGSGTCLVNAEGLCWCGQHWDGEKMCSPDSLRHAENKSVETDTTLSTSEPANPARLIK